MVLSWLWGEAQTNFYSADETIQVKTKTGSESLIDLCKAAVPPCRLSPFLFNGHLQTIWTTLNTAELPIYYKRKTFEADDENYAGSFTVDFVDDSGKEGDEGLPPRTSFYSGEELEDLGSLDQSPMLVLLHGLSGGSYELYIRQVIASLLAEPDITEAVTKAWKACVVNARGCANSKLTSSVLFNARATWDVRQVVQWLRVKYPNRPLFCIGFSLGANILVNYLGEEGSSAVIKGAVVISNPWNLDVGSVTLQQTWLGLHVYSRAMGTNVRKLFEMHEEELSKNPELSPQKIKQVSFLHEFDREVQCASWGYPTEGAYYRDASSIDMLCDVRVPLLAINAEDDPIVARQCIPYFEARQNPYVVLCTTSRGGHIGWFSSGSDRWYPKPAVAFLKKMASDVAPVESDLATKGMFQRRQVAKNARFRPSRRRLQMEEKSES